MCVYIQYVCVCLYIYKQEHLLLNVWQDENKVSAAGVGEKNSVEDWRRDLSKTRGTLSHGLIKSNVCSE